MTKIIIHGKRYDITDFAQYHPGGSIIYSMCDNEIDQGDIFNAFHSSETAEMLANYYVEDVPESTKKSKFAEKISELDNQFRREGLYNPCMIYFTKLLALNMILLVVSVILVVIFPYSFLSVFVSALGLALFWQQCGWLAHDFAHHAIFKGRNRYLNNIFAIFLGNLCQGFSCMWWKNKHNTHHALPNVHGSDPDIDTLPFIAWSEHDVSKNVSLLVMYQNWLYIPLLGVARLSWNLQSIIYVGISQYPFLFKNSLMSSFWKPESKEKNNFFSSTLEGPAILLHWGFYIYLLTFIETWTLLAMYLLLSQCVASLLLAAVFTLNHNGMEIFHKNEKHDFFTLQVLTGRDLHPNIFTNWFCGGLNFQIEHHLFPAMPRHNYPLIQPIIKKICEEYGIAYHSTSFWKGSIDVFKRVSSISRMARNKFKE